MFKYIPRTKVIFNKVENEKAYPLNPKFTIKQTLQRHIYFEHTI